MKQSDPNTNREQLQTYCLQLLDMKQISMNHQQITTVRQHATKKKTFLSVGKIDPRASKSIKTTKLMRCLELPQLTEKVSA